MNLRKILVIGATSAIATECLRRWSEQPVELVLVGRSDGRLQRLARDLGVRSPSSKIHTAVLDFMDPVSIQSFVADQRQQGPIDLAMIAHGSLPEQEECQADLTCVDQALALNGISPSLFAEAIATAMIDQGAGTLAIVGSVAGDRGRKSNYIYGAAKGMLDRYAEGLQHRLFNSGVALCLIKPGPTLSPMTAHLAGSGLPLADISDVADTIVKGVDKRKAVIYAPGKWALIMWVIRHLPRFVFNRLDI
ncbi:MAG: SDR family NAD(P)-dependent oxidoreductase [Halioglobus sp.]